ncbi:ATP-dependent helicase [Stagnihabitans tardus]|uniref:DNA 3'-5' helicase n=1 Tax=Stagnihabitans tardus TaxID=2699202 RepID=A0AAE5BRX3_9RHOB|nr:UvrD-helicase domain-containing protein [Stagnihabitans tardus]NBZ87095.1 UvrD-helicase domain-containing protein [Stagnihabitans tardus]
MSESLSLSARALAARAPVAAEADYLNDLNPAQREAVEALDGPVLMLAGAGTGKTKALVARIIHLVRQSKAYPNQILAVTFTNKAAREMKTRILGQLGEAAEGMAWMGTFHSLSVKILRRHAELVGLKSSFTILDTDDQLRLLKQLIAAANIDEKRWPARLLAGLIDGWKNRAWTPDRVPASEASAYNNRGTELYEAYQDRLKTLNAVDFGDILLHCVTIFQRHRDVLEDWQRRFRYILVDEYQDTNVAQYLWLRLLAQAHHNICCVGDDDQSIYGWRGAEVGNILRFEADFPGAVVVRLEQNYRSTPHILAAASGVIKGNANRLGKTLWTEETKGEKVRLIGHWDGEEEARWVGEQIEDLQRGRLGHDLSLEDMAILVRASHQMRAFEDRFLTIGLPYRVIGGPRFYERQEIRDAMAYFRLAVSPGDDLAFERVYNLPKRGLGEKAFATINQVARAAEVSLLDGARECLAHGQVSGKGGAALRTFVESIDRWNWFVLNRDNPELVAPLEAEIASLKDLNFSHLEEDDRAEAERERARRLSPLQFRLGLLTSHIALAEAILEESGYTDMWVQDKTPEAPGRLENLKELVKALEQFENLTGFLEHVSLIMENESEEQTEKVSIMTLHAAKGLEFPAVFLPGWEEGLFPSQRSMDESGQKGLEEERRLAYVGITRAEELCTISFASNRRVYGQWQSQLPSRFIDELPADHVDVLSAPSLHNSYGMGGGNSFDARVAKADVYNSPGWRRLQNSQQTRGVSAPREASHLTIDAQAVTGYGIGERVFHQKFGYGNIVAMEGDKLEIDFEHSGLKNIVARWVIPAHQVTDVPF